MASRRWQGKALAVAQVNTITVAGVAAIGQGYSVVINGKTVFYTASGVDTNTTIAAALQVLLAASTIPEFLEVTWTVLTTVITGTAATPGKPFTNTSSATGTGTLVTAITTVSSGPSHWDTAANWSGSAVPVGGDDVFIDNNSDAILYSLDQNAVTLLSMTIENTFGGKLGLPTVNKDSATGQYYEYREQYLKIGCTTTTIGDQSGVGSGRIKLNNQAVAATVLVHNSGVGLEADLPAVIWKGTHAANVVNANDGSFGAAVFGGEVAVIATLKVGNSVGSGADVRCGAGVTLTAITISGGSLEVATGFTTLIVQGGTVNQLAGSDTTVTLEAGSFAYQGVGTISTLNCRSGSLANFGLDPRARTVTAVNIFAGATLLDPQSTINPLTITLQGCDITEVTVDGGPSRTVTFT